jgi:hypothetical protein
MHKLCTDSFARPHRLIHPPSGRVYHPTFNPPKVAGFDDVSTSSVTVL